jgi:hypothetical protein
VRVTACAVDGMPVVSARRALELPRLARKCGSVTRTREAW